MLLRELGTRRDRLIKRIQPASAKDVLVLTFLGSFRVIVMSEGAGAQIRFSHMLLAATRGLHVVFQRVWIMINPLAVSIAIY